MIASPAIEEELRAALLSLMSLGRFAVTFRATAELFARRKKPDAAGW